MTDREGDGLRRGWRADEKNEIAGVRLNRIFSDEDGGDAWKWVW